MIITLTIDCVWGVSWHQIGIAHQEASDYESAEAAYRRGLEIRTKNNYRADQAASLGQLGNLYMSELNRLEEAVTFYRQAADIYIETGDLRHEGFVRNNIANTLQQLKRYDEARAEIMRAIECANQIGLASELWKSFSILCDIEEATGNPAAARAAWAQARDAYLAYRRQGGYAQSSGGQLVDQSLGLIQQGKASEIGKDFTLCRDNRKSITYRGLHHCIHHLRLGLQGEYQLDNGALATGSS